MGPDSKGTCEECGKSPRKLSSTKTSQLVCSTCKRKLEPPRPKHLATEKSIEAARRLGFKVDDDATKEQVSRAMDIHSRLRSYVKDVWFVITGQRAPCQKGELTLEQFVTKLFKDRTRLQRIVNIQQKRKALSEGGREPPPVPHDEDYQFVAAGLRTHFEPVGTEGDLRVDVLGLLNDS